MVYEVGLEQLLIKTWLKCKLLARAGRLVAAENGQLGEAVLERSPLPELLLGCD
jgi:hypothetical protein